MKWTRFGPDVIGAWVAEMDFGTAPVVTAALHQAIDDGQLGYLPDGLAREMARACAEWQARTYGWDIGAEHIHPLADVIRGLEAAIVYFSEPGRAVVLPTPAYMPFFQVPGALGREIIQVPMIRDDAGVDRLDLAGIGAALSQGGHLVVLCNPHNPIGRVYEREELLALADVVEHHGGRVFADEIHAPLVYAPARHVPYASVSPVAAGHSVTATSASKAWNLPGLKCAQFIVTNDADAEVWEEHGPHIGHGASTLGVIANTAAYDGGREWLDEVLTYLDGNRHALAELLAERVPGVRYRPPQGTYLAWLEGGELACTDQPGDLILERGRVALVEGTRCGESGCVRLNFATPRPILAEIVERMATALGR